MFTPTPVPVVLLIGQSNMRLPGVATAAAQNIADKGGLVVYHAISGSPLSANLDAGRGDWSASGAPGAGEHLDDLRTRIDALLNPDSSAHIPGSYLAGAVWVQGEADAATSASSQAYGDNLVQLRNTLVDEYGQHDWAIASLSGQVWDYRTHGFNREPFWDTVRSTQLEMDHDPGFHTVDPDALAKADGYGPKDMFHDDFTHYKPAFGADLGNALGNTLDVKGDANLQVGTGGNDYFYANTDTPGQIFGSLGTDTADFSKLSHGIRLNSYERELATAHEKGPDHGHKVNLVEVEKVVGTSHNDTMRLGTITRDVRAGDGNDKIFGHAEPDAVRGQGGNDMLAGRGGNDALIGGNGDDRLFGQDGNDRLYGGNGNDFINAGRGDDYIVGGHGNDEMLLGNKGADQVVFQNGDNGSDIIKGFSAKDDTLSFKGTGITKDDLFLSAEDSNLRIQLEMQNVKADILIEGGAHLLPDNNGDNNGDDNGNGNDLLDWITV